MTLIPPLAASQAGATSGGGLLDAITGGASGATQQAAPSGDGSVGLLDGVFKKALLGGAVGAGVGFLPFIPGGPILGGIVGALAGAGYGLFKNFKEMKAIQAENQAFLGSAGVQINDPMVQQALIQGNPQQLLQMQAQQIAQGSGATGQTGQVGQGFVQAGVSQVSQGVPGQVAQGSATQVPTSAADPILAGMPGMGGVDLSTTTGGVVGIGADGKPLVPLNGTATQQAPPAITDPSTPPVTQGAAAVTPNQAALAGGGDAAAPLTPAQLAEEARAREERIALMWLNATPEEQEALLARLKQRADELDDLIKKLQTEHSSAA